MQSPDPRNTNRIEGYGIRASLRVKAKPIAIKGYRSKCGGSGMKAAILTQGGLSACLDRDKGLRKVGRSQPRPRRMANPSEGPNMETKGEALKIHGHGGAENLREPA
jgi:hypothetical protein